MIRAQDSKILCTQESCKRLQVIPTELALHDAVELFSGIRKAVGGNSDYPAVS